MGRNRMNLKNKQSGFTLIEVFAAMVVFALGLLALTKLQVTSIAANSFANDLSQAATLAENTMEQLMALAYTAPELLDSDQDGTTQDGNTNGIDDDDEGTSNDGVAQFGLADADSGSADHALARQGPNQRYGVYWNVAIDQPNINNKRIRVIVDYRDQKNRLHRIALESIKSDII